MEQFYIEGGRELSGEIKVQGAKNSVLPILAATILHPGQSVLHNCPRLRDVEASVKILRHLGCAVRWEGNSLIVDAKYINRMDIPEHLMREMRSSVIFLGAVLARCGRACVSMPGGCELGPRPIDLHLMALRRMGTVILEEGGTLACKADELQGCEIPLGMPSVGATENAILAACGAEGITTIYNVAREPEIGDLQNFLNAMGHHVSGAGSSTVRVERAANTADVEHRIMPDRIVAATYLSAVASAGGEVLLRGVDYRHLSTVLSSFLEAGCRIRNEEDLISLRSDGRLRGISPVRTAPYPGFPTDAQAVLMAALLKAKGTTVFVENIFENRYRHVDELSRMGADIRVEGRVAVVCGVEKLRGASVRCTDLRGGAALVTAGLGAQGTTCIGDVAHIQRGYEDILRDMRQLGASVWSVP